MRTWVVKSYIYANALVGLLVNVEKGLAWCLDEDKGACSFNIRSKAQNNLPRSIKFHSAEGNAKAAIEYTPTNKDLLFLVGGDTPEYRHLVLSEEGYVGLGATSKPKHILDIEQQEGTAVLKLSGQHDKAASAVKLENRADRDSFFMILDSKSPKLAFSYSKQPNSLPEPSAAQFTIHGNAPAKSASVDESGHFVLHQAGSMDTKFPKLVFKRSRALNPQVEQIVFKDDLLGKIEFNGYEGTNFLTAAAVTAVVDGVASSNKVGARLEFCTASVDAPTCDTKLTISSHALQVEENVNLSLLKSGSIELEDGSILLNKGKLSVGGSLKVAGETEFGSSLIVSSGDVKLGKDGQLLLDGGSITAEKGDLSLKKGNAHIGGSVSVEENASIKGSFQTVGVSEFLNSVTMKGEQVLVDGSATSFKGPVTMEESVDIMGKSLSISGSQVTLKDQAKFEVHASNDANQPVVFLSVDPGTRTFSLDGSLNTKGPTNCEGPLSVHGPLSIQSESTFSGELLVQQSATIQGPVVLQDETDCEGGIESGAALSVRGGLSIGKSLFVSGPIRLGPKVTLESTENDGQLDIQASSTTVNALKVQRSFSVVIPDGKDDGAQKAVFQVSEGDGTVKVDALFHANSNATFSGDITCDSSVQIEKDQHVKGSVSIAGSLDANGSTTVQHLKVEQVATFHSGLTAGNGGLVVSETGDLVCQKAALSELSLKTLDAGSDVEESIRVSAKDGLQIQGTLSAAPNEDLKVHSNVVVEGGGQFQAGHVDLGELSIKFSRKSIPDQHESQLKFGENMMLHFFENGEDSSSTLQADKKLGFRVGSNDLSLSEKAIIIDSTQGGPVSIHAQQHVELKALSSEGSESSTLAVNSRNIEFRFLEDKEALASFDSNGLKLAGENSTLQVGSVVAQSIEIASESGTPEAAIKFGKVDGSSAIQSVLPLILSEKVRVDSTLEVKPYVCSLDGSTPCFESSTASYTIFQNSQAGKSQENDEFVSIEFKSKDVQQGTIHFVTNTAPRALHLNTGSESRVVISEHSSAILLHDGTAWSAPYPRHMRAVHLEDVVTFTTAGDLDMGNHSMSTGGLVLKHLSEAKDIVEESTEDSGDRIALVGSDGSLRASSSATLVVEQDGTLRASRIGAFNASGSIDMQWNDIKNVRVDGGRLLGITELEVKAGMRIDGELSETSDRRLKDSIERIDPENALELVKQMQGVKYRHIKDPKEKRKIGLIAQDVEALLPEVVTNTVQESGEALKSLQYQRLVPILIESIKALEARVAELERQVRH